MRMDPMLHVDKKPSWIKVRLPNNPVFWDTKSALERLAREFAAIEKIDQDAAALRLEDLMDAA